MHQVSSTCSSLWFQWKMPTLSPVPQHQIIHVVHSRRNLRDYFKARSLGYFTSHAQDASLPLWHQQAEVCHHCSHRATIRPTAVSWTFTRWDATQHNEKNRTRVTNPRNSSALLSHCRLVPSFPRCPGFLLFPCLGLIKSVCIHDWPEAFASTIHDLDGAWLSINLTFLPCDSCLMTNFPACASAWAGQCCSLLVPFRLEKKNK